MHRKFIDFLGENKIRWVLFGLVLPVLIFSYGIQLTQTKILEGLLVMIIGFYPILTIIFSKKTTED